MLMQNSGSFCRENAKARLSPSSLRAKRSNPDCLRGRTLDCFVASLLAMTTEQLFDS